MYTYTYICVLFASYIYLQYIPFILQTHHSTSLLGFLMSIPLPPPGSRESEWQKRGSPSRTHRTTTLMGDALGFPKHHRNVSNGFDGT